MNLDSFLNSMPEDELRILREKISSKLEGSFKKETIIENDPKESKSLDVVYQAFSIGLTSRSHRAIPWSSFRGSALYPQFRVKALWLSKFIKLSFNTKTKVELSYACNLSVKLLIGWLDRIGVPLSYKTLVNNADRIPSLIEEAFPGYIKAGLLKTIIKQAKEAKTKTYETY